eukprot:jgi/Mesvir1/20822/Mv07920-RA.1
MAKGAEFKRAATKDDLLIVGPGVLGSKIAKLWLDDHPAVRVVGQTNTEKAHERLRAMGVEPRTKDGHLLSGARPPKEDTFPYVVFCAPPSGSENYVAEVEAAALWWNGEGAMVFTSSSTVYAADSGEQTNETSPTFALGANPRADCMLQSEKAALAAGGCVVRLAGLYTLERGAHTFWAKAGKVNSRGDAWLNLIHYDDAASLVAAALKAHRRSDVFLGVDDAPLTREHMMQLTMKSGLFGDEANFCGFLGHDGPLGRRMSNTWTRKELGWAPKYASFAAFLDSARIAAAVKK